LIKGGTEELKGWEPLITDIRLEMVLDESSSHNQLRYCDANGLTFSNEILDDDGASLANSVRTILSLSQDTGIPIQLCKDNLQRKITQENL
jgi:hypothetical protein